MKNKKVCIAIVVIICLCMSVSFYFMYSRLKGMLRAEYENELRVESGMIANAVDNSFLRPITVSETMSKDVAMRNILNRNTKEEAIEGESEAREYLKAIRDGFGYSMVYAVSDSSKAYFTYDGIRKFIDTELDKQDIWYNKYFEKKTDKSYILYVDNDEVNDWALSVFVNTGVYDETGKYIGQCGVGVEMTELQKRLEHFERIHDIKICLIDKDGLIQVCTDDKKIGKKYIKIDDLELYTDGECYYEIGKKGSRTITYIDNLEWYLVVQDNQF